MTVEAAGLAATPGFIDTHVHTDMTLLDEPLHECLLHKGVTTVVRSQDVLSYAPLREPNLDMFRRYLAGHGTRLAVREWRTRHCRR